MKYLSIDIEATGLQEDCLMIEFAAVPFDAQSKVIANHLAFHTYIKCPSLEELRPTLDSWVIDHNSGLITKAHEQGLPLTEFKNELQKKLQGPEWKEFFGGGRVHLFGKSLNAIDLPFLRRDLSDEFMRTHFSHKVLDVTSVAFTLVDLGLIPHGSDSSGNLMKFFQMGDVAHTALEDAINTIKIYFLLLERAASGPIKAN